MSDENPQLSDEVQTRKIPEHPSELFRKLKAATWERKPLSKSPAWATSALLQAVLELPSLESHMQTPARLTVMTESLSIHKAHIVSRHPASSDLMWWILLMVGNDGCYPKVYKQ